MTVEVSVSPRAEADWEDLPEDAHALYLRLFDRLRRGVPMSLDKREGGLAKEFGVKDLFSARANVKYRALLSRQRGGGWRVEALASRGDSRYYRSE